MKIKHLKFEYNLEGSGIVNCDSGDQKYIWNRESKAGNKNKFTSGNDNNKYSKKYYFMNDDGVLDYGIKISSDCLRNSIFRGDAIAINPTILHHRVLLNSFIGSTLGLVRGYMFADKKETVNRKSPLTITPAMQDSNSVSYMEIGTKSGDKMSGDDGKGGLSLRNTECVGDITYSGKGSIDIAGLEFLSCDPIFDRYSFNPDEYDILKKFLSGNLPNFSSELGYHTLKTSSIDVSEYGIKLSSENVMYLVKEALRRVLNINISRSTSYAKLSGLRIQLVSDVLGNNEWIDIKSMEDIDNLDFEVEEFYVLADESKVNDQRKVIEDSIKLGIEAEKSAKKVKASTVKK